MDIKNRENAIINCRAKGKVNLSDLSGDSSKEFVVLYHDNEDSHIYNNGPWSFTLDTNKLNNLVASFNNKQLGRDLYVSLDHEADGSTAAVGWFTTLRVEDNKIIASIDWTDEGKLLISSKKYRYFSCEFSIEGLQWYGWDCEVKTSVFHGGSLTNDPYFTNTQVELNNKTKESKDMDKEQLIVELSKHGVNVVELQNTLADKEAKIIELNAKIEADLKASEKAKISVLLEKLIVDCKSTQVLNDSIYGPLFENIGYEKAVEASKNIQQIVKTSQESIQESVETVSEDLTDEQIEDIETTKIVNAQNLSYEEANKIYCANKRKEIK